MTEQQPSDHTEYLEAGGGAPLAPESTGRSSRRTAWLVGGGVVGALAIGAGAWAALNFFQQGAQPAEALPASTVAYLSVDLDPSGGQKIDAFRTLNKFPAFKDKLGIHSADDVRRKIGEELIKSTGCSLTFDADIDPWLGDRAAIAAVDLGDSAPDPVFVVQAKDDAKADAGMHELLNCGDNNPVTDVGYDVHDGWVVIAQSQDIADKAVAAADKATLADDATYQKWTKAVGESGVVSMYAAPAAGDYLATQLDQLKGAFGGLSMLGDEGQVTIEPDPGTNSTPPSSPSANTVTSAYHSKLAVSQDGSSPLDGALKDFQGAAATLRFTGGGLEFATASDPHLSQSNITTDQGSAVVSRLPDDTAAAFGLGLKPGWVTELANRFATYTGAGQTGQDLLDQLAKESGLDVPADIETLFGSSSALSVSKDFDYESMVQSSVGQGVPVAFTVKGDAAAIEKVLAKLRAQDSSSTTALASDSSGDLVAIGPTAAYRQQILSGGHLGDTDAFRGVIPDAAHASMVLYVNIDDLEHAITQASADDNDIIDNITPLQAIGFSSWMDGEVAHTSLKIGTN
jgi:hypothetical protein